MSGAIIVPHGTAIGRCVEDLLLVAECSEGDELEGRVLFLPL
jgi:hypothetical protein